MIDMNPESATPLSSGPRQLSLRPELQEVYARLTAGLWTNISPGQDVLVTGDICHIPLMERIREAALERGASEVLVVPRNFEADRQLLKRSGDASEYAGHFAELAGAASRVAVGKGCFIRVEGRAEPDSFEGLDGARLNALESARAMAVRPIQDLVMRGEIKRCVLAAPTAGWAAKIFPDLPPADAYRKLEQIICSSCHITAENPEQSFLAENEQLEHIRERLRALQITRLRFLDEEMGTDLEVGLTERSKWLGGVKFTPSGEPFFANVPIGELFTTADFRTVNGTVAATMPGKFSGVTVRDIALRFVNGEVTDYDCEPGKKAVLDAFFADPRLRRIGEIALASVASALGQNNCFFDSILLDEKMRCHLALGEAYLTCIEDSVGLTREAQTNPGIYETLGINYPAAKHVDIMISRASTRVWGIPKSGAPQLLVESGRWAGQLAE